MKSGIARQVALGIKKAREEAKMSQGELARKAGVKRQRIARIEAGDPTLRLKLFFRIARALNRHLTIRIVPSKR
jgi:DNA-binding XRE family transcriptional regulator